ncbi:phosphatidylglycerophosphatase A family protein [Idiomarina aminovorans]|uniref:phosphatidylglycerophosphatase A family protein n=1 Tax=Idiomarina aminovorans TaxID=2914829 RepID=UPI002003EE9C|nr:phosphatidylglycerophosphatase A [Idiomarina sp. ATCH4]MCK7459509.1 phosphatidylglycerophosphatase A [Idiomarina sp. ATCH4]
MPKSKLPWFNPVHWLALGFGSGLAPKAPGTFGTLVGIPLVFLLALLNWWEYLLALVVMTVAGIWICQYTAKAMGEHDHPSIVWDEIVGYAIAMFALPVEPLWLLAAFILFRIFDIWKPGPIGWADKKLQGGSGIMMDDVLAGIFSAVLLHLGWWLSGLLG